MKGSAVTEVSVQVFVLFPLSEHVLTFCCLLSVYSLQSDVT